MVRSKSLKEISSVFVKPFSQACENNKQPIFDVLKNVLANKKNLLEIGSGTGQHAAFMAPKLPSLQWHTSDRANNHQGIAVWLQEVTAHNLHAPIDFTIGLNDWPLNQIDAVFSANTAHIMQVNEVQLMMALIAQNLPSGGVFCQYGPFTFAGQHTSESNREFGQNLIQQGYGGIRDVDELTKWAEGLVLHQKIAMPANNFMLVWHKL